ncbi:hypothetical protein H5410_048001, partial [Solanum commersonii]
MKNSSQSTSHGSTPLLSQLKGVKAYKFDRKKESWHPVEHKSGELVTTNSEIGVVNLNSLRKLSLSYVKLDENMLQTLLNSFPLIVSFIFEYCSGLEMIELVNLRKDQVGFLKVLKIRFSGSIWEIDAPNLVSFAYIGNQIPELQILRESRQLKHPKIILQIVIYNCMSLKLINLLTLPWLISTYFSVSIDSPTYSSALD